MSKTKQTYPHQLCDNGQATLLLGFATQIQRLTMPRLNVVKEIGKGIGIVVMTAQEFERQLPPDSNTLKAIRLIYASTEPAESKLNAIAKLLNEQSVNTNKEQT